MLQTTIRNFIGNGNELKLEGPAVEQQSVSCFPQACDKLNYDADPGADKSVFSMPAKLRHFRQGQNRAVKTDERKCAGDFNGRRGTESRTDRNLALDQQICALWSMSGLLQDDRDPENIVTPGSSGLLRKIVQIKFEGLGGTPEIESAACVRDDEIWPHECEDRLHSA